MDLSLRQAAAELGQEISAEEAHAISDRKLFKERLEEKRLAHYSEIGSNPKITKDAVVGMIFKPAERLAADREDFKSADALLKLAKDARVGGSGAGYAVEGLLRSQSSRH
jgi:hypothetical protein